MTAPDPATGHGPGCGCPRLTDEEAERLAPLLAQVFWNGYADGVLNLSMTYDPTSTPMERWPRVNAYVAHLADDPAIRFEIDEKIRRLVTHAPPGDMIAVRRIPGQGPKS